MSREIALASPGEILLEEFLKPLDISPDALAQSIHLPPNRVDEIVHGRRAIDVDVALRLAKFFGTDAQSWLNLQTHYDTEREREALAEVLARIRPYRLTKDFDHSPVDLSKDSGPN